MAIKNKQRKIPPGYGIHSASGDFEELVEILVPTGVLEQLEIEQLERDRLLREEVERKRAEAEEAHRATARTGLGE